MADDQPQPDQPIHISADDARGSEIILGSRARRFIFLAGLIGSMVIAVILMLVGYR